MTKLIKSLNGKEFLAKYARHAEKDKNGNSLELGISNDRIVSIGGKSIAGGGGGGGTDYTPGSGIDITGSVISVKPDVLQGATRGSTAYQKPSAGIPSSDMSDAVQVSLGKADSALQQHQDISGKADKSEMSVTPGTGTDSDKVTVQLKAGLSAKVLKEHQDISGKQDTIGDLDTIRSGATAGASAYQKPSGGIPSSDMSETVQAYLRKADSAYQKPQSGIPDSDLSESVQASLAKADTALQQQDISGKADKSEMSVTQGTGTDSDKTTIQLKAGMTATVLRTHQDISGKQDTISDLESIRSGAGKGETAYQKPVTGIPKGDLANDVQTSLGKADTALQQQDIAGKADKSEMSITPGTGNTTIQLQTGMSATVLTSHQDISGKVDKVVSATEGNFAAFDSNGNIVDSGKKSGDFATAAQGSLADTAYQKPNTGIPDTDMSSAVQTALGKAGTAYQKPGTGIPKSDLDSSVQTSLGKADSALQSQDITGKVDKISGGTAGNILVMSSDGGISDSGSSMSDMQPKLIPGANITIVGNTISAVGGGGGGGTDYTPGTGILISGTTISVDTNVVQKKLTPGSNISIASDGTISATDTTYSSESAAEGGTAVSLVTTGEKYAWGQKYDKPSGGIPGTDLAQAVNNSLNKADNSIQGVKVNNVALTPDSNGEVNVTVPAAQQNADWNATSGITQILNRPNLATVATTGAYSDLSGTPTIPTVDQSYNSSSANAQSGAAVASAISGVRQVPAAQSSDRGKVLGVTDSSGTIGWVEPSGSDLPSTTGNSGKVLKVNSGGTGVEWADDNDTTYESKSAASGGTDVSLVTTGEKYTWNSKQETISDLSTIRSGAEAGATAYQLPANGIPSTDLSSDVNTSLSLANSALQQHQDISGKADKVSSATSGNFAGLDSNGNLTDSGSKASDFATSAQGGKADSAIQGVSVNGSALTPDSNKVVSITVPAAANDAKLKLKLGSGSATDTGFTANASTDQTIEIPLATHVTSGETVTNTDGLMSGSDKEKLDGIEAGANNYTHPSYTERESGLYKVTVNATGHVSSVTPVQKSDITALGIPGSDTTYESKQAAEGGTAVSLVTTGEKYEWGAKYSKPSGGIPSTDLSSAVQTSLDKADTALQSSDLNGVATKVSGATTGNLASLDSSGNLADSGKKASDFATAAQGALAASAIQGVKVNNVTLTPDANGAVDITVPSAANDGKLLLQLGSGSATATGFTANASSDVTVAIPSAGYVTGESSTTYTEGLMSGQDKEKLAGIAANANNYTHPSNTAHESGLYKVTVDGLGHVTAASAVEKSDITSLGIPGSDTTYSHLSASSGGTDVSLVTTGEMYNWNSKQDALSFDGTYNASTNKVATENTVSSAVSGKADKSEMSITAGTGTTTIQLKSGLSTTVLTSHQDISGKADKSEMSVTAGTGTNADKTTIQLKSGLSAVVLTSHQDISGKQDTISDLQDIRDGAGAGATAYQKPSSGIPSTDLAAAVQTSLGKADTAYQKPSGGIPDTDLTTAVQTSLGKADSAYQKPSGGIPDTDLASAVQTSLDKADSAYQKPSGGIPDTDLTTAVQSALTAAGTAIQGVKLNGTALTPDSNKAVNVTVNNATITIDMAGTAASPNRSVGSFTADQAVASTITIPAAVSATPAVLGEGDEVLSEAVPAQPGVLSSSDKDKLDSLFNVTGSDSISLNPSTHALSAIVAPDGGVVSGANGLIVQPDLVSRVVYVGNTCVYNDKEFWSDTSSVDSIINDYANQTVTDYRGNSVPLVRFVSEYDSNRYRIACIDETPGTVDYNRKIGGQLVDLIRSDFWLSSVNGYDIIRFDKDMATLFDLLMSGSPMNAYLTLNNMSNTAFITDARRELYMDMIKSYDAWPYADKDTAYSDFMDEHSLDRFVQVSTTWPLTSWNSYRYVMAGTKTATDKVIFVLRHAERGDDTSVNGDINSTGVTTCTTMGEQARNNATWTSSNVTYTIDNFPANDAAYYSTEYLRCKHSAQAFASARYDTDFDASDYSEITVEADMLNQYRFFYQPASSGNSDLIRKYAVDPSQLTSTQLSENFGVSSAAEAEAKLASDYERVCKEILNKSTARLNLFYTHDFFTLPLAVLASNKYFTFSGDSNHDNRNWINYCAGIGMILHPDDTYEVMPVRGKSNGSMTI